eukprot:scaffold87238_cov60-Phaeocystis_antarctica.AAC.2
MVMCECVPLSTSARSSIAAPRACARSFTRPCLLAASSATCCCSQPRSAPAAARLPLASCSAT